MDAQSFKIGDRVIAVNWHGEKVYGQMGEGIIQDIWERTEAGETFMMADCWWNGIDCDGSWRFELLRIA